ncbi:MAG: SGNH/GDSL hydrolase family protein [Labilithrix sp.]|nr:SGNH/GDSL hydrolase family protein [Labilithrix sp.]MCW5811278.1 SGNH/GDSL hydrolase family protein [Labilithrix sp.]
MMRAFFLFLAMAVACSSPTANKRGSSSGSSGSSGDDDDDDNGPPVSPIKGGTDPETGEIRYLALGDSLTQGVGASDESTGSFPARLAKKWRDEGCEVELLNVGVSGYTAQQVVDDQLPQMADFKPTIVTFQAGANDIAHSVTLSAYRTAVKKVLTDTKATGARVIVLAQNEWFRSPEGKTYGSGLGEQRATFDAALIEEVEARDAEFVDMRAVYKRQADANAWVEDGIHPTDDAYEEWATELARVIPAPCK